MIEHMKAITIWQPWASLLACGAKLYETRGWATNYRGSVAIHAGLHYTNSFFEPFGTTAHRALLEKLPGFTFMHELPRGCIIATAELVGCHPIWTSAIRDTDESGGVFDVLCAGASRVSQRSNEFLFGDWTPGRYAWEFANMRLLEEPIPAKGRQGLWNCEGVA